MKKILLLIISMGLIGSMNASWFGSKKAVRFSPKAICEKECEGKYVRCADSVRRSGSFNYFKCINEKKECLKNCELKLQKMID